MYKYIHGCRSLAALFVVACHLSAALAAEKHFGALFFFALSGFIITLIHRKDFGVPARVFAYLKKRAVRIYPAYLIIFTVVYLAALAVPAARESVPHDIPTLIKSLLLLPQERSIKYGTGSPVISVAWTLQYEIVFYSAIALVIIKPRLIIVVGLAYFANLAVVAVRGVHEFPQSFFASPFILLFFMGMGSAYLSKSKWVLQRPLPLVIASAAAFLSLAAVEVICAGKASELPYTLGYGIISAILIVALVRTEDAQSGSVGKGLGRSGFIMLMGDASYVLYLIHFPIISLLCKLALKFGLHGLPGALLAFVIIFALCILASLAFHLMVERPILARLAKPIFIKEKPCAG